MQFHQRRVQILHVFENASAVLAHGHDIADKFLRRDDRSLDERFPRFGNQCRVGVIVGIVNPNGGTVGLNDFIDNRRQRGDQIQVKLAFQALLNDFHMQHTKETTAETEAQCNGGFRLKRQRGIVEL